jgi:uncharacterized FlaG/YvyC family protein
MQIEFLTSGSQGAGVYGTGAAASVDKAAAPEARGGQEAAVREAESAAPPADSREVESAIRSIEDVVREQNIYLKFSRDSGSGTMVLELIDQTSGEPVLQIPSEVQLRLAEVLGKLQGNIFNQKA